MTKEEVSALFPEVLSAAREWVTRANAPPRHADSRRPQEATE
jgi:hypothetical protein